MKKKDVHSDKLAHMPRYGLIISNEISFSFFYYSLCQLVARLNNNDNNIYLITFPFSVFIYYNIVYTFHLHMQSKCPSAIKSHTVLYVCINNNI